MSYGVWCMAHVMCAIMVITYYNDGMWDMCYGLRTTTYVVRFMFTECG